MASYRNQTQTENLLLWNYNRNKGSVCLPPLTKDPLGPKGDRGGFHHSAANPPYPPLSKGSIGLSLSLGYRSVRLCRSFGWVTVTAVRLRTELSVRTPACCHVAVKLYCNNRCERTADSPPLTPDEIEPRRGPSSDGSLPFLRPTTCKPKVL